MQFFREHYIKLPIVLYVLGFAVHNAYLSLYGSYEFELIQARYILSGIGFFGFVSICVAYMSFHLNLSYLPYNYRIRIVLPWLLRVFSLPAIIYIFLHGQPRFSDVSSAKDELWLWLYLLFGQLVVFSSLSNILFSLTSGNDIYAKIVRALSFWCAIPFLILCFYASSHSPELKSLVMFILCFLGGFAGLSLSHVNRNYDIEAEYLSPEAKEEHENSFQIIVGILALCFVCWSAISKYSEDIYPYIPTAIGGSKIEAATLYSGTGIASVEIIQETSSWFLVRNLDTKKIEKIKASSVDRVVYAGE
ncbi:hypothetical protein DDM66_17435 [Vibrio cholerae]|nr:hypothetical protein [Vibrio cholerae]